MSSLKSSGQCVRCAKPLKNASMGRHLAACLGPGPAVHIAVDVGPGTWWMHLALGPTTTLRDLDAFLRATWLECCGHMSAFDVGSSRYESSTEGWEEFGYGPKPKSMGAKAATVFPPGTTFTYEYDFGSTTQLRGRVIGSTAVGSRKVTLLARNEAIVWPCEGCGGPAARVCPHCFAMACAACDAPCTCVDWSEDEVLPVVDSPRMGVCGYGG